MSNSHRAILEDFCKDVNGFFSSNDVSADYDGTSVKIFYNNREVIDVSIGKDQKFVLVNGVKSLTYEMIVFDSKQDAKDQIQTWLANMNKSKQ